MKLEEIRVGTKLLSPKGFVWTVTAANVGPAAQDGPPHLLITCDSPLELGMAACFGTIGAGTIKAWRVQND